MRKIINAEVRAYAHDELSAATNKTVSSNRLSVKRFAQFIWAMRLLVRVAYHAVASAEAGRSYIAAASRWSPPFLIHRRSTRWPQTPPLGVRLLLAKTTKPRRR